MAVSKFSKLEPGDQRVSFDVENFHTTQCWRNCCINVIQSVLFIKMWAAAHQEIWGWNTLKRTELSFNSKMFLLLRCLRSNYFHGNWKVCHSKRLNTQGIISTSNNTKNIFLKWYEEYEVEHQRKSRNIKIWLKRALLERALW